MNSPYMGKFRVSQTYKKGHTGLDLVGIDSKEIHSTVSGIVDYAGWENSNNHKQGFGQYVVIKDNKTGYYYYFGHLSQIKVKIGQNVNITDIIGIEGSTGYSIGSHCHYEIRTRRGIEYAGIINVSSISGIPNLLGGIYDDGYRVECNIERPENIQTQVKINMRVVSNCSMLNLRISANYGNNIYKSVKSGTEVEYLGMEKGWAKIIYEGKILYCGKNYIK